MVSNKLKGIKNLNIPVSIKDYESLKTLKKEMGVSWEEFLLSLAEFKIKNSG